jgi:primosomal protein N'
VIAKVEPLTPARVLRGPFDYELNGSFDGVGVGSMLVVPFGRRRLLGVVVDMAETSELPPERLAQPLSALEADVPPALIELGLWVATEYCSTPARGLALVLPPGTGTGAAKPLARRRSLRARLTGGEPSGRPLGEKQLAALEALRDAGLEAIAELPMDTLSDAAVGILKDAGFRRLRLTIENAPAADRRSLIERASALQDTYACIQAVNPLPTVLHAFRPTTGYEDVKAVAIARLAAPNIPTIQVDWSRYGPKLAQVALTFGADDLDAVTASDEAPDGRRRAPIEEVRRNIEAAGFTPAERDGRFAVLA